MITKHQKHRLFIHLFTIIFSIILYFIVRMMINTGAVNTYVTNILNHSLIAIIMAVSLNMVTGLMGQLVLGHAGFMLVGAYVSALFTLNLKWTLPYSLPISLIIGGLVSALFGVIIGIPALRLKGDYLAIITLGFGEIIRVIANNLKITNGAKGLYGMDTLDTRNNPSGMFTIIFFITVLVIYISYAFGTSRHGRAVISIRDDEIAAESVGIPTTAYKLMTFTLAAFFAGVAGGLYAHQLGLIDPSKFDFNRSVEILVMVVLGGMGSITGAIIASVGLTVLPEFLRLSGASLASSVSTSESAFAVFISKTPIMNILNNFSAYRMLLYSGILIIIMLFRPTGLLGRKEFSVTKLFNRIFKKKIDVHEVRN